MKNLDKIAQDLFNNIRGRFDTITIGDDEGKITTDPAASRFYDFKFDVDGNTLGSVSVALFDDRLSVMYNQDITADSSDSEIENWYAFLRDLRKFSKRRLLGFETRDISKSNLDRRDYKFLAQDTQVVESRMYGSHKKSYENVGNARLRVNHSRSINTESRVGRTQHIDSIFIESPQGERFKYPHRHLKGARAMARHISEGGTPYDDFGKHIIQLSEELNKLSRFNRHVRRSGVVAEGLTDYVKAANIRVRDIRKQLDTVFTESGYKRVIGSYEQVIVEDVPEDVEVNWIDQLTIKQFNEELRDIIPYVYRLVQEQNTPTELDPETFLEKYLDIGQ